MNRLADKRGPAAHLHLRRGFDGRAVLREEGKYAYAAAYRNWRTPAAAWLAWLLLALEQRPSDAAPGAATGTIAAGDSGVDDAGSDGLD